MTIPVAAARPRWSGAWIAPDIAAAVAVLAGFAAIALAISRLIGVPINLPGGGNIPGLGTSIWVPPLLAAAGYLLVQLVARAFDSRPVSALELASRALTDYFLLGLFILVILIH